MSRAPPPVATRSPPICARLGRARAPVPTRAKKPADLRSAWTGGGASPHTNLLHTNLADYRELHGERIRERRHAAKEKRRKRETPSGDARRSVGNCLWRYCC